jgi:hypothetical protein
MDLNTLTLDFCSADGLGGLLGFSLNNIQQQTTHAEHSDPTNMTA